MRSQPASASTPMSASRFPQGCLRTEESRRLQYVRSRVCLISIIRARHLRTDDGRRHVTDPAVIVGDARMSAKVSCVVGAANAGEVDAFVVWGAAIGVRRVVIRRLFGDTRRWPVLTTQKPVRWFKGNPTYEVDDIEVTVWNLDDTQCRSVNLFPNGMLGTSYLLTETAPTVSEDHHSAASPSPPASRAARAAAAGA